MSIIIRLQNLPLSAKSADIRNFFGGLHIPDGGVHIIGGEKGEAYIAFMSDEDGRIAMRKDGGRIKDARVRLLLSSRMEMQYAVEKVTKHSTRDGSHEKKRRSRSKSPYKHRDRTVNEYRQRSRSPVEEWTYRSRRRSRSPRKYLSSERSPPPRSRISSQRKKSASPEVRNYTEFAHEVGSSSDVKKTEHSRSDNHSLTTAELQAELERRITEELDKHDLFKKIMGEDKPFTEHNIPSLDMSVGEDLSLGSHENYLQRYPNANAHDNMMSLLPSTSDIHQFQEYDLKPDPSMFHRPHGDFSLNQSGTFQSNYEEAKQQISSEFYIMLSGLDCHWNFKEVQVILKGIFAPQNHIRFETHPTGLKTGVVFVKLTNKDDFDIISKKRFVFFRNHKIKVSECPNSLRNSYFPDSFKSDMGYFHENNDYCYILKGLPFSCTYNDIAKFFYGFEIASIKIQYNENGRASGTGFVSFKNRRDFEEALSQNGKKIQHRYIEMLPCTKKEMSESETPNRGSFIPYSKLYSEMMPPTHRPLCAIITGLPFTTSAKKLNTYFAESSLKPHAIHLTYNRRKHSDGRAFLEFTSFLDFDLALKFHGKQFNNNTICVKQILFDEMIKILDSQKAKHYFASTAPAEPALNVPEKVPYLWEPPDATEEHDNNNSSRNHKSKTFYDHAKKLSREYGQPFISNHEKQFIPNKNFPTHNSFNSPSNLEKFSNTTDKPYSLNLAERGSFIPAPVDRGSFTPVPVERGSFTPVPVENNLFHVDLKAKNSPNPFERIEENIKISKLSPENEAALLHFLNKKASQFEAKESSRSPKRKERSPSRERSPEKSKKESKDEKLFKSRSAGYSKSRSERDSGQPSDSSRRSPFIPDRKKEDKYFGCVVHVSNVSLSVGTQDLKNFLNGFDFYEDTLIRRYTADNEPTRDVRVMFLSKREAERAVRTLNNCYLRNVPVTLSIL